MILVFAGAGASAAIDIERYPTTEAFYKRLGNEINSLMGQVLRGHLKNHISQESGNNRVMDIEKVLWYIKEFKYDLSPHMDAERISCNFWRESGLMQPSESAVASYVNELSALEQKIYREIHEVYYAPPTGSDTAVWDLLIKGLAGVGKVMEIFTTNYDRVLEKVVSGNKISTGIHLDDLGRSLFDYTFSDVGRPNYNGRLTKLHGSINWIREGKDIVIGTKEYLGDMNCILYPGSKEAPRDECFRNMHHHLYRVSGVAECAVFIGFSFRDEYINQILRSIPSGIPKAIINQDREEGTFHDDFPFTKESCLHIGSGFSKDSAAMIGEWIAEKLGVS